MSFCLLPTELVRQIASYLPPSSLFQLLLASDLAYRRVHDILYRDLVLSANLAAHAVNARQLDEIQRHGAVRSQDLAHTRTFNMGTTFSNELLGDVLPKMGGLRALTFDMRVQGTSEDALNAIYSALGTLPRLQSLTITNLPEYHRDRERCIIPFHFIESGHRFDLSRVAPPLSLTHLNICVSDLGIRKHLPLRTSLKVLVLQMPRLDKSCVDAIFELRSLKTLRLIEPKRITPWEIGATTPSFTELEEFGFGERNFETPSQWQPNMLWCYCERETIPHGFMDAIISTNPGIRRLTLLHLTDGILARLVHVEELEVVFSIDHTEMPTFSQTEILRFLERQRGLRRLILPFTGLRLSVPLLRALEGLTECVRISTPCDPDLMDVCEDQRTLELARSLWVFGELFIIFCFS